MIFGGEEKPVGTPPLFYERDYRQKTNTCTGAFVTQAERGALR
jgi:hypothetical protein